MATTVTRVIKNTNILPVSSSNLVVTKDMVRNFGSSEDYVELHISDPAGKKIFSVVPFLGYKVPGVFQPTDTYSIQELEFDPALDLQNLGVSYGDYSLTYNVLRPKVIKNSVLSFFIKEISDDRTEIRLSTNNISNDDIESSTLEFINEFQSLPFFKEFYINFGNNSLIPAVNIALDLSTNPYSILIKLLNPLPIQFVVDNQVNIVDQISNQQFFDVNITLDPTPVIFPTLRGPNFDLDLDNVRVGPTPYYNFNQITTFSGSFAPQVQQLLGQLSASNFSINVNYEDFEDFVHYSSAARRLEGFRYKLETIELHASASSSAASSTSTTAQLDAQSYQNKINNVIQSFDGWEQYLYYESSSYAWPKTNSTKPYINYSVTASQAVNWYVGYYSSASLYDDNNQNYLLYALPGYISENDHNELLFKFVASIGQMFDDIWIHIKAITDLYKAKNSLTEGISKDLVYFALQSMGINTYTDEDGKDVFQYLYGVNPDGTYKFPTGSYETLISASNYQMSGQDQQKGIYKRMYHNLPLLLKSKGTTRFIQYLNTIFGIPSTVMSYVEYGGVDKVTSSFEYEFDRFTYALNVSGTNTVSIPWVYTSQSAERTGFNDIVPNGIEFRFKASPSYSTTQSLFYSGSNLSLNLQYTGTGSNDSIYSGSAGNFGYLQFNLGSTSVTSSTVPVFTTGSDNQISWYSVLVQRRLPDVRIGNTGSSQTYDIYIKNNVWGEIGHVASASLTTNTPSNNLLWYRQGSMTFGGGVNPLSGSLQEIRLWSNYISESVFDSHVLNPESIEGNTASSSYDDLTARFALGNNLFTYNHNLTSSITSVAPNQNIQTWIASFANFPNTNNYLSFTETYYADVANSGYANPVTDKVRIISGSEYGTQLLPNKSIIQSPIIPLTKDIHILDASLSPMDEIDKAIIAAFGSSYDLDDIIGDPDYNAYNNLRVLQSEFFKKFINKYNYKDFIRLIEFFHNSLFRTLKDFTPARTNLSTGVTYRPHLLERPMVLRSEPNITIPNNFSVAIDTAFISGSNGGGYYQPTYSYTEQTNVGPVTLTSDGRDFYTGVFPSGTIVVDVDQFNPFTQYKVITPYSNSIWYHDYNALLNNVSGSRLSTIRKKVTYITSGSRLVQVLEPVALQDFTYNYIRHIRGRYVGSNTTSTNYNVYNDLLDSDFNNYGKKAAIDKNTVRFAYLSEAFATGSDLIAMPERTNLYIKYLIDDSGSLTELSKRDYKDLNENNKFNLYQVQNIFKSGEKLNISLFDNQNPSRQSNLDGNKEIFAGGFRFHPVLWRTGSTNLVYGLDSVSYPNGTPDSLNLNQYIIKADFQAGGLFRRSRLKFRVERINPGTGTPAPAPQTEIISYQVRLDFGLFDFNPNIRIYTGTIPVGQTVSEWSFESRGVNNWDTKLLSAKRADAQTTYNYSVEDTSAFLSMSANDPTQTVISCSTAQSRFYPGWFFSASLGIPSGQPSIPEVDYNFTLEPGDLVRFADNSLGSPRFIPSLEYEIAEVYPPTTANPILAFKILAPSGGIANVSRGSQIPSNVNFYRLPYYVFSKKIPDETNIVINHKKNPGRTSGGVVKNINLSLEVENKLANLVSDLKSKIFSTVLTP